jgi:membrane-bound ClpP family serine protease
MNQVIQISGAVLILAGFILAQLQLLSHTSRWYLLLNLAGSAMLTVIALFDNQWGFVLLEGTWAVVSGVSLAKSYRSSRTLTLNPAHSDRR